MFQPFDMQIKGKVPFLKGKTVLLIENPAKPILLLDTYFLEDLKRRFKSIGYNYIFLPELVSGIAAELSEYVFPGYDVPDIASVYENIRSAAGIGFQNGFLYKIGRQAYFKNVSGTDSDIRDAVYDIESAIQEENDRQREKKSEDPGPRFSIRGNRSPLDLSQKEAPFEYCPDAFAYQILSKEEFELDAKTVDILADVQCLLKNHHLTLDELRAILGYQVKISRLEITRNGKILLMDFLDKETGEPKEVKMDILTKMVYLFYLKHPEGVRVKEVQEHIHELMHLYMGMTGRDDIEAIRTSILNHVAPYGNSINVSMSRIKYAFKNLMDESVAKYYWIEGRSGEPYSIAIDRDKVIWEYGD